MARIDGKTKDAPVTGSAEFFVENELSVFGVLVNVSGNLVLSSSVGSLTVVSGNLDVLGNLTIDGEEVATDITGATNFFTDTLLDARGVLNNTTGHLILSSSVGSVVALSATLKFPDGTTQSTAHVHTDTQVTGATNFFTDTLLDSRGTLTNTVADLTLSSSTSQSTVSGNLDVLGNLTIDGEEVATDVTGATNFFTDTLLDARGVLNNTTGHLILSSSAGSVVALSATLKFPDGTTQSTAHVHTDTQVTGATNFFTDTLLDARGVLNNTTGHLILSSSAGSVVALSSTLKFPDGTTQSTAHVHVDTQITGATNFFTDTQLDARGVLTNTVADLTLSSSTSQVTVSGNLDVSGTLTVNGDPISMDVTGATNFFADTQLDSRGVLTNTTGHLILSSSTSQVTISGNISSPGVGTDSEQFGLDADATGNNSMAIGYGSRVVATGERSIAIGSSSLAEGSDSVVIGLGASIGPSNDDNVVIGVLASASDVQNVVVGRGAYAQLAQNVAIGRGASCVVGGLSVAVGKDAIASNTGQVIIGALADAGGNFYNMAIGYNAAAPGAAAEAIGYNSSAGGSNSLAIGHSVISNGSRSVAVGPEATALPNYAVALGYGAHIPATGDNSVAIGRHAGASGSDSVVLGYNAWIGASDNNNVVVGAYASSSVVDSVALGHGSYTAFSPSVALGRNAETTAVNQLMLGSAALPINTIVTPDHLILSSSVGSVVALSATLKFPDGTTQSTAAVATDVTGATNFFTDTQLDARGVLTNTTGDLILSASTSQITVSGTLSSPGEGANSEVFGLGATRTGDDVVRIGNGAIGSGSNVVVIGKAASDGGWNDNVVVGESATANRNQCVVIGQGASHNDASSGVGVAIGYGATSMGSSVVVGHGAYSGATDVVIGRSAIARTNQARNVAIGYSAETTSADCVAVGYDTEAGQASVALGKGTYAGFASCTIIGYEAAAGHNFGIAIGREASTGAGADGGIAIGYLATTGIYDDGVAVGRSATNTARNQLMLGSATYPVNKIVTPDHLILSSSVGSNVVVSGTIGTQVWTTATVTTGSFQPGQMSYVSDGDGGSPCLALWDGSDWLRVSLGAAIDDSA